VRQDDEPVAFKYDYIDPKYPGLPEVCGSPRGMLLHRARKGVAWDLAAHRVPACAQIMHAFYKGPVEDIPCTGPAPLLIRTDLLRRVLPAWEEITKGIEVHSPHRYRELRCVGHLAWCRLDPVAWLTLQDNAYFRTKLGWVREMYAYSLATAVAGVPHRVEKRLDSTLIAQPPADDKLVRALSRLRHLFRFACAALR